MPDKHDDYEQESGSRAEHMQPTAHRVSVLLEIEGVKILEPGKSFCHALPPRQWAYREKTIIDIDGLLVEQ